MPLYRITVKQNVNSNGIRLEKGMSVDVVNNLYSNPILTNVGQAIIGVFCRNIIDIIKAGPLNMVYVNVKQ